MPDNAMQDGGTQDALRTALSAAGLDRITVNPGVLGGMACIRGMRFSVSQLLTLLSEMGEEQVLDEYPYLEPEDLAQARRYAAQRQALLPVGAFAADLDRITVDPRIMGGAPCLRRTGIPVATVVGMAARGSSEHDILTDEPDLEPDDIRQALLFAARLAADPVVA